MRDDNEDPGGERDGDPLVADADADEEETPEAQPSVYFRLLNGEEVAGLLVMDELIEAMRDALRAFSSGDVQQPVRSVLTAGARDWFGVMPALASVPAIMGAKLISVFGRNAAVGLPTHLGVVALFSPHTGALVALLDGRTITEARTAAVSALSAGVLARDDAETLAIIGTGAQARAHLVALERQFQLKTVRVWSPTPDHQLAFVTEMQAHAEAKLVGADSAELAVHGADLIVLATSATDPVIRNEWVRSGAHVVSIGACRPDQREIDPALIRRSRLFVDSRAAALVESGDIAIGIREGAFAASHIAGELGDVVAGRITGRRAPGEVTLFKSLGLAVEDVVAAHLVYQRAIEQNVGLELRL
jgi:ornithine cyclodeaminase